MTTPCYGKSWLFDSIDPQDHREAKELCASCPMLIACQKHLRAVIRDSKSGGRPEGTWAGQLLTDSQPLGIRHEGRRTQEWADAEDARYTEEQARTARSAYHQGDRSPWVVTGNRVFNRRKKRNQRQSEGAA